MFLQVILLGKDKKGKCQPPRPPPPSSYLI